MLKFISFVFVVSMSLIVLPTSANAAAVGCPAGQAIRTIDLATGAVTCALTSRFGGIFTINAHRTHCIRKNPQTAACTCPVGHFYELMEESPAFYGNDYEKNLTYICHK